VNIDDLAKQAARMSKVVLSGTPPENVPIEVASQGTPILDWRALQRWKIPESRLPADAVVNYRPVTLWDEHRALILILLGIFAAQTLTIAGLFIQRGHRQRAEREVLRQQTELAHVNRVATIGQLTSALAHELTQPLGAILRNTEAAEIVLQQGKPDITEVRAILSDIRKDDQRAGNVIERMRSLLKRRSLELKPLELDTLLGETFTLSQSDADTRGVELTLQIREKLPVILGDRVHLQQVLLNLILNGMDAMAAVPRMERKLIVRTASNGNGAVEVAVIDWGPGIPPENIAHLFEPFFTTKSNGMGMGLAISRTIIEAHGGKIWCENIDPRGAVFKFTLPVKNIGA
jgi:C4-dicarboxylate-specific signal transduction histidine kinase